MNKVAAPCCGSCKIWNDHYHFCREHSITTEAYYVKCEEGYSPRNPIPLISIPGVKELVEKAYGAGYKDGFESGSDDFLNPDYAKYANAYRTHSFYKYIKALEDKDEQT